MIDVTTNGASRLISDWLLRVPQFGEWRAHIRVESKDEPTEARAAVVMVDELGNEWHGTARAITDLGAYESIEVIGGADRLDALTSERYYASSVDVASAVADVCGDVGERAATPAVQTLPQWRMRGRSARAELEALAEWSSGVWRVEPTGELALAPAVPAISAPPGILLESKRDYRVYECPALPPLVGGVLDGWTIGCAIYVRGAAGPPCVTVWEARDRLRPAPAGAVGATVEHASGARVDVRTDTGADLSGLPLWSAAGMVPRVRPGARVMVVDLGGDPRATVALSGPEDAEVDAITLAQGESELLPALQATGRVVRYGDMVVFPVGAAATPTAMPVQAHQIPATPVPLSRVKA